MNKFTLATALLFALSLSALADDRTGPIIMVQSIGDAHPTAGVRGNVHIYIDNASTYYVIPSTEPEGNRKAMLSIFLTAQETGSQARIISDGSGVGTRIVQAFLVP